MDTNASTGQDGSHPLPTYEVIDCTGLARRSTDGRDYLGFRVGLNLSGTTTMNPSDLKKARKSISHAVAAKLSALYPSVATSCAEAGSESLQLPEVEQLEGIATNDITKVPSNLEPGSAQWNDGDQVYTFAVNLTDVEAQRSARAMFIFDYKAVETDPSNALGWSSVMSKFGELGATTLLRTLTRFSASAASTSPSASAALWAAAAGLGALQVYQGSNMLVFMLRRKADLLSQPDDAGEETAIDPRIEVQLSSLLPLGDAEK